MAISLQTEAEKRAQKKYRQTKKYRDARKIADEKRADKIRIKRLALIILFGNRCYLCGRTPKFSRYFAFHHLTYKNGSPYEEYSGRYSQEKILKEIEKHPENFRLLDVTCHFVVELILKDPEALTRLIEIIIERNGVETLERLKEFIGRLT